MLFRIKSRSPSLSRSAYAAPLELKACVFNPQSIALSVKVKSPLFLNIALKDFFAGKKLIAPSKSDGFSVSPLPCLLLKSLLNTSLLIPFVTNISLYPSLSKSAMSGHQDQSVSATFAIHDISLKVLFPLFNCKLLCMSW